MLRGVAKESPRKQSVRERERRSQVTGEGGSPGPKRLDIGRGGKGNKDRQAKFRALKAKNQSPSLSLITYYSSKQFVTFPSLGFLNCERGMTVCPITALLGVKGPGPRLVTRSPMNVN